MRTKSLPNGDVAILADNEDRAELADAFRQDSYSAVETYVLEGLHEILYHVLPEWVGALTDAPIFAEAIDWPDQGDTPTISGAVYWFPNYCITDPWRQLANTGRVVFQNADNA